MSYSFSVGPGSKADVKVAAAAKFDEVIQAQPAHVHDKDRALENASSIIDALADEPSNTVTLSMNGYVATDQSGAVVGMSIAAAAQLR